jgi:hypothetical protein
MDRDQIVRTIQNAAQTLGVERLTITAFRQQSGISQYAVSMHFDSWSQACKEAGIDCGLTHENLVHKPCISEAECISELQRVADLLGQKALSSKEFSRHAQFTSKPVIQRFGSWQNALTSAGLELCEQSKREIPLSEEACIQELQRIAKLLNTQTLTQETFDAHAQFSGYRIIRACGSWVTALQKAGLRLSPNYRREIPLSQLASAFEKVVAELNSIPTLMQLVRRSRHASDTFSRNRGGYNTFKRNAIEYLLSKKPTSSLRVRTIITEEMSRLKLSLSTQCSKLSEIPPHHQGRTLNFRAFVYAPTSEHDVVQIFGAIAHELGFEIVGNRSAFPDCEARRKTVGNRDHYVKCLIEYEFSSKDYKNHAHPLKGCDLIVCWVHNWLECPIEVLDLSKEIKKLSGWR